MIGLIDADILVYRCAFAAQKKHKRPDGAEEIIAEPVSHALHNVDSVVENIEKYFKRCEFFLSGKGNFRYDIATVQPYKANRGPKPVYYHEVRGYFADKYMATFSEGEEADDLLGKRQTKAQAEGEEQTCIVTIDKDLDMIPGMHYNFVKDKMYDVSERDGFRSFYKQVVTGDRTDNIPGLDGIGPVKASRVIDKYNSERAMWQAAKYCWHSECPDGFRGISTDLVVSEVAALLWIAREGRERWAEPE